LDGSLSRHYSPALVDTLQLLMHPDPARRPSAAALATQLLSDRYPFAHEVERKASIFPPASLEELVQQLRSENAALRAKVSSGAVTG
jgi:hypothetical protein